MVVIEARTPAAVGGTLQENVGIDSNGVMTPLLDRGTPTPCEATVVFSTGLDDQEAITVPLLRGMRMMAGDNEVLGTLEVSGFPKSPAGIPQVAITLAIRDGDLVAYATEAREGTDVEVTWNPAG
ncbi:MAG: Hsp70 family protein [Myxococcales bacterium]|nr:Hsp70 family protein [Myxococcales bacterium]